MTSFELSLDRGSGVTNDRMMVIHVGLDLVSVAQVTETLEGPLAASYLARVYTEDEIGDCRTPDGIDPQRLAARFAAKEATLKVLAEADGVPWRDIEVERTPTGAVRLTLHGRAAERAAIVGVVDLALSVTHEDGFAAAVVIADCRPTLG
jgi:holo-[acyl-carrier protein] synthase